MHKYTGEEIQFLRDFTYGHTHKDVTEAFNNKFGTNLSVSSIKGILQRNKIKTGSNGQFKKGSIPYNKGKHTGGWEPTQFKKGHHPVNHKPVGSERIDKDGYTLIKTAEPNIWKLKHRVIWESVYGPIPKNHTVIFKDGNKLNLKIDNLMLVDRRKLLILNRHKLIQKDKELTESACIVADLLIKIQDLKKANHKEG